MPVVVIGFRHITPARCCSIHQTTVVPCGQSFAGVFFHSCRWMVSFGTSIARTSARGKPRNIPIPYLRDCALRRPTAFNTRNVIANFHPGTKPSGDSSKLSGTGGEGSGGFRFASGAGMDRVEIDNQDLNSACAMASSVALVSRRRAIRSSGGFEATLSRLVLKAATTNQMKGNIADPIVSRLLRGSC